MELLYPFLGFKMSKWGCGESSGVKFRAFPGSPGGSPDQLCSQHRSQTSVYHLWGRARGRWTGSLLLWGPHVMATVKGATRAQKEGISSSGDLTKKALSEKRCVYLYFEDNPRVTVNNKGEMKGSAFTGPVAKGCADVWLRAVSSAGSTAWFSNVFVKKNPLKIIFSPIPPKMNTKMEF